MPAPEDKPHALRLHAWHAGVSDLERSDPSEGQASTYALLISDTYLIEEGQPQQLTNIATRNWSDVAYFFAVRLSFTCSSVSSHIAPLLGVTAFPGVAGVDTARDWAISAAPAIAADSTREWTAKCSHTCCKQGGLQSSLLGRGGHLHSDSRGHALSV